MAGETGTGGAAGGAGGAAGGATGSAGPTNDQTLLGGAAGASGATGAGPTGPAGGTGAAGASGATGAAPPLELKLPAGIDAKDPLLEKFKPLATKLGLDSAKAQELLDLYAGAMKPMQDAIAAREAEEKGWVDSLRADKEFGGAKFGENVTLAQSAVRRFGGDALVKVLNETGLGNHPVLARTFAAIGRATAEDSSAGGAPAGGNDKAPANYTDLANKLYGPPAAS